ncbi:SusD/RagB family nutrient-binding outer membrane lipoprotein [Fodinibius sp. Rm-B-1B1-1]|uniref:SusD/RagB family nutrient-binding outer membrane lipoprotein n=1 Tax=Fodinibius alkaliphilus TaxID=3140241 RepID=UPI00315AA880
MRKIITSALLVMFVLVGCDDLTDKNIDPNNADEPRTDLLLTEAQRTVGAYVGSVTGTLYVQYFAETQYTDESNYATDFFSFASGYTPTNSSNTTNLYSGALQDLQTIIDLNNNEETRNKSYVTAGGDRQNQIAVAKIMQAYLMHTATDRWGDLPYSEALKGAENYTPAYDTQEQLYTGLIDTLDKYADQIDTDGSIVGDFLFADAGSDQLNRWVEFANTIRARMALRLTEVDADYAQTEFEAAYDDGLLETSVMFPYLSGQNNDNPWQDRFETRTDYAISTTMTEPMKELDDMRLTAFAEPAANLDNGDGETEMSEVAGLEYGLSSADAGEIENDDVSFPGSAIGYDNSSAPLPIVSEAEIHFMIAEAAARGWSVTEAAATAYNEGITASWNQWGVDGVSSYLTQADVAYDPANWEEQIGYEKWIALFPQGYEAWAEWRRLGYPQLDPANSADTDNFDENDNPVIPVRQGYPTSEPSLNGQNYQEAVGEDFHPLNTNLWWDVD